MAAHSTHRVRMMHREAAGKNKRRRRLEREHKQQVAFVSV